jgi:uncharacterized protein YndB with AHSA1/START domain
MNYELGFTICLKILLNLFFWKLCYHNDYFIGTNRKSQFVIRKSQLKLMSYNWKQFSKRIPVKAPVKTLYTAWTTQQGLESWFLRLAQFTDAGGSIRPKNAPAETGDTYKWLWFGYCDDAVEEQKILSVNGWDQLSFSFSGGCIVTVSFKQEQGETICELVQQMPMEDEKEQQHFFIECGKGWTFYLANLKSVLEGGLDLRNKNEELKNVISA